MSNEANLSGFQKDRYFSRAWAMLTQEKGWWKPVALCALASLVPVVGPLAVFGYCLEWARRVAWGSTEAPSRHVKVGQLIKSGWRGAVVFLGWNIVAAFVGGILGNLPWVGELLSFAWGVFMIFVGMLVMVAAVRATVYQNFKAGYRAPTLWQMGSHDPWGLLRVWLISLVAGVIVVVVALFLFVPAAIGSIGFFMDLGDYVSGGYGYYMTEAEEARLALEVVGYLFQQFGPAILITAVLALVSGVFVNLLSYCGVALWLRQFNVPTWGRDEDPLPEPVVPEAPMADVPVPPVAGMPAPVAPSASAAPAAVVPAASAEPVQPSVPAEHFAEPAAPSVDDEPASAESVACPSCGAEVPSASGFCPNCGAPMRKDSGDGCAADVASGQENGLDAAPDLQDDENSDDDIIEVTPIAAAPVEELPNEGDRKPSADENDPLA